MADYYPASTVAFDLLRKIGKRKARKIECGSARRVADYTLGITGKVA